MRFARLVLLAACTVQTRPAPPPPPPPPPPVAMDFAVDLPPPPAPEARQPAAATRNQPAAMKLKLGHYRNTRVGVGLVIDRTQDEAKLRFDDTDEVLELDAVRAGIDRTDYMKSAHQIVMQIWDDSRVVIYIPGGDGTGIDVRRDGDADPL